MNSASGFSSISFRSFLWMLDAGGITAGDFIAKRLPLVPAILLFVAVIGFVALVYYLGGKKICDMNLVEAIKDDALML